MLDVKVDEVLTAYEDVWREAALRGQAQFYWPTNNAYPITFVRGVEPSSCAASIGRYLDSVRAAVQWRCPLGCDFEMLYLFDVLVHLNDQHRWTWDQLANKTRDVLVQGMALASEATKGGAR